MGNGVGEINSQDMRASETMTNSYLGKKAKYQITNWAEHDQALVNRGDMTEWFEKAYLT